jgi:hypothetical protein
MTDEQSIEFPSQIQHHIRIFEASLSRHEPVDDGAVVLRVAE